MSGIVGVIALEPQAVDHFLICVSDKLLHRPWYQLHTWKSPEGALGLGVVNIGIFNNEVQPHFSDDRNIVLLMVGEFYNRDFLIQLLSLTHEVSPLMLDAQLAVLLYQKYGATFVERLDGVFFIAIYDSLQHKLILVNDRFGLYPHYYTFQDGNFAFAPQVKGVLCAPFVKSKLNMVAVAEYFRFQQLLGEKTFHQGISLFPYGSIMELNLQENSLIVRRYWDWDRIQPQARIDFRQASLELGTRLRHAVERRTRDALRPGVFLSGGLDSRTLLGLIPPRKEPIITATFGIPNSRDVQFANQVANQLGTKHLWFDLSDGQWILNHVDFHLQVTEGFHSWIHMHGISMLPTLRGMMDYNVSGWDGGTVMGHSDHVTPIFNEPIDEKSMTTALYTRFNQAFTWPGMTEAEENLIYTKQFSKQANGLAFESLQQEFRQFLKFPLHNAAEYFYIVNHCWRMTQKMITFSRSHIESRFPFWDYELIDYIYSLQPDIRKNQLLYRDIITRELPKLAVIPYDKQEFLPTRHPIKHTLQASWVRLQRRLGVSPGYSTLYADYEVYLRNEVNAWAKDILFAPQTAERNILNIDFVRSLIARHESNNEQWTIGKIAPLITFEMMMREFFD